MLTEFEVVDYIKRNLGAPINHIEISDDDIIQYVRLYTLPLFSRYKPYEQYLIIDISENPDLKLDNNFLKLPVDPNHEIIAVQKVLPKIVSLLIANMPINPFPSWNSLPDYLQSMTQANTASMYNQYNRTFSFFPPDKLKITPWIEDDWYMILATFVHSFDTIPVNWKRHFLDLALADICDYIASLRVKFQNYSTPYGDINLNWDYFQNKAQTLRQQVMDELKRPKLLIYCRRG